MADTTGDIRTIEEILGDEVVSSLRAGRNYIVLTMGCVERITGILKSQKTLIENQARIIESLSRRGNQSE